MELFDEYESNRDVFTIPVRDLKSKQKSVMTDLLMSYEIKYENELSNLIEKLDSNQKKFKEVIRKLENNEPQSEIIEVIEQLETMIADLKRKRMSMLMKINFKDICSLSIWR